MNKQYEIYYSFYTSNYSGSGVKIITAYNSEDAINYATKTLTKMGYTLNELSCKIYC